MEENGTEGRRRKWYWDRKVLEKMGRYSGWKNMEQDIGESETGIY